MRKVFLHGRLAKFGGPYKMEVGSVAEALRGLMVQLKGLADALSEGAYRITAGAGTRKRALGVDELTMRGDSEIHVIPVAAGAGKGATKAILGLSIVAGAFTFGAGAALASGEFGVAGASMASTAFSVAGYGASWGSIAAFGAMMAVGGISQMLSPQGSAAQSVEDKPSYYFNGPINVTEEGNAVPWVYGRGRVGSVVISSGMSAEAA